MSTTDPARRLSLFRRMLAVRRFEEGAVELNAAGLYVGHCHVAIGQEATCAALGELLRPGDLIADHHRNHGHYIALGLDAERAYAEMLGRATGTNGGRGGAAHLCDIDNGFVWSTAIVGGSLGFGIGAAFALRQQRREGAVAVACFGDGALEEGIAFEAMNMAAILSLPVLFLCENNSAGAVGIAAFEWPSSSLRVRHITDVPGSLAIPSMSFDGGDAETSHSALQELIGTVRAGGGPVFAEARTQRWPGGRYARTTLATGVSQLSHAWDPANAEGEHAGWIREYDPLLREARQLVAQSIASQDELLSLDEDVSAIVSAARERALAAPAPTLAASVLPPFARR